MATDKQSAEKEITVEEKLSTLYQLQTMMTEIEDQDTSRRTSLGSTGLGR